MTHDELLAKIDIWKFKTQGFDDTYEVHGILKALRAVVKLHKPTPENRYPENICQNCSMTEEGIYVYYPCPTIQAIEKELV